MGLRELKESAHDTVGGIYNEKILSFESLLSDLSAAVTATETVKFRELYGNELDRINDLREFIRELETAIVNAKTEIKSIQNDVLSSEHNPFSYRYDLDNLNTLIYSRVRKIVESSSLNARKTQLQNAYNLFEYDLKLAKTIDQVRTLFENRSDLLR